MPTIEELDAMARATYGMDYDAFDSSKTRVEIMQLCLMLKRNTILEAIQNDTDCLAKVAWGA